MSIELFLGKKNKWQQLVLIAYINADLNFNLIVYLNCFVYHRLIHQR